MGKLAIIWIDVKCLVFSNIWVDILALPFSVKYEVVVSLPGLLMNNYSMNGCVDPNTNKVQVIRGETGMEFYRFELITVTQ